MSASFLSRKSVCVITGPTRGLGRSMTKALSSNLPEGSLFILLSRNEDLLDKITHEISSVKGIHAVSEIFHQDSRDQDVFDTILQKCLDKAKQFIDVENFEQAILVSNAGSLEPLDFSKNLDNLDTVSSFFHANVVAPYVLTAKFLQIFLPSVVRLIINISSLSAISPMNSWSLYCMAKAARDMQMKVVGKEEENLHTLNYAPGPLNSDMAKTAAKATKDPQLKKWFNDKLEEKSMIEPDESAEKLIKILREKSFENGEHIDFYDV